MYESILDLIIHRTQIKVKFFGRLGSSFNNLDVNKKVRWT